MKKCGALAVVLILALVGLAVPLYLGGYVALGDSRLKRFSSYEQLRNFIYEARWEYAQLYLASANELRALSLDTNLETYSLLSPDYSKTNNQVEGVDEADVVKTDGQYIFIISGRNVTILKAYPPEEAEILSQITLNGTIYGLFINGDKMVIFEGGHDPYISYTTFASSVKSFPYYSVSGTFIRVYDVSNRANPVSMRNVTLDGCYFNSRMIGDYVYAVINKRVYANATWVSLPIICSNGEVKEIDATQVYYSPVFDSFNTFATVIAVNTQNDAQEPTEMTILLGDASNMYVSMNNIYITFQGYGGEPTLSSLTSPVRILPVDEARGTTIHRIHIEDDQIEEGASGHVQGRVLNQFSMDEYNGYLRIATTTGAVWRWGEGTALNHVYILDTNLNIVGRLENLAPGEQIHSTRFMGDRCYVVTFKKIDPLFVIDLSNPSSPSVLGDLHIPGYSDYLHPYDENHIIGVGKDTVEGEGGNFAWYQGVKISLFDVSDVEHPQELDKYIIGDRGTESPVLTDHKAFLFDRSRNLLVIPVLVAERPEGVPPWTQGNPVFQGAYVFDISLSGLVLNGRITHLENATGSLKSGYYFNSSHYVGRSLYIDNVLYTISSKKIKMNSLETLAEINEIEIP